MADSKHWHGLGLKLAGSALVLAVAAVIAVALTMFSGGFTPTATVTIDAPRSGLVLDPAAKVKMRGVEIGHVAKVEHTADGARLRLAMNPEQLKLVPANATVDIRSTTVFGAKYVNFVVPDQPSKSSLQPGAVLRAQQVTVEFNTLFQHLSDVLAKVQPDKLNGTLSALGVALQGRGQKLGELLANGDTYLRDINPSLPALQQDLRKTGDVTNLYGDTVDDLLRTVNNAIVTSGTVVDQKNDLDGLLADVTGLADTTGAVLRSNEKPLETALDLLRPTTGLLDEYSPALSCLIVGLAKALPLGEEVFGGLQEGVALNTNFMYGAKAYKYPDDLPKVNATGGPHCEGLVDRVPGSRSNYVVTDTNEGKPYVPSTKMDFSGARVLQLLYAGLPGVPPL
ncbi:MCE family protein [Nocardia arthritidis]|uniref:MCE family protein n=1 Tax=Nocardia arthritidis TaxID=228602 RepID=A0A6G9Y623_9NOCA|nr:MCE family protein [Nocardia arthritidis]QIS08503.1 MCE family protein [Nocardia arthritidis]